MDLSIIIPCYNEGKKLVENTKKIVSFMESVSKTYELIIVNDGSTDSETEETLNGKCRDYLNEMLDDTKNLKRFEIISYEKNRGKGGAVKEGIANSNGDIVLFMDADLSTNLLAIMDVIKNENKDVIIGSRRLKESNLKKPQNGVRKVVGKCCKILTNAIVPLNIQDTQCGFKAFNGEFAREMITKQTINRFAFDVEYLYIAQLNNKSIVEIPVIWENDEDSKVTLISSSVDFFKSLLYIRKNKDNYYLDTKKGKEKVKQKTSL